MDACFSLYIQIYIKMPLRLQNHLVNFAENDLILRCNLGKFLHPKQGHKTLLSSINVGYFKEHFVFQTHMRVY